MSRTGAFPGVKLFVKDKTGRILVGDTTSLPVWPRCSDFLVLGPGIGLDLELRTDKVRAPIQGDRVQLVAVYWDYSGVEPENTRESIPIRGEVKSDIVEVLLE